MTPHDIRTAFLRARERGLRAKEAAESCGLREGEALAAFVDAAPQALRVTPLEPRWLDILQALEACGPVMALTRNESAVHEKTGVYRKVSSSGHVGLALGEDIDLRLFFNQWHAGFAVQEPLSSGTGHAPASLQFFDPHGTAVHKVFVREATDPDAWLGLINRFRATAAPPAFRPRPAPVVPQTAAVDAGAFARAWGAMTDTHQFFPLLRQFGLERRRSFQLVEGRYTRRVPTSAVRDTLVEAAFDGTSIMVFVGSPGCIQIHSGPVKRVEPLEVHGKTWLNVLDPGFNLHLREDHVAEAWVVEKPTADGVVSSLEAFDAAGALIAMFFGARKPGQAELPAWRDLLAHLPPLHNEVAA